MGNAALRRVVMAAVLTTISVAQSPSSSGNDLEKRFKDKVFYLRDFNQKNDIRLSADGTAVGPVKAGAWTTSLIEVKKVEWREKDLVLSGNRLGLLRDPKQDKLVPFRLQDKVEVWVSSAGSSDRWYEYFVADVANLAEVVPEHYKGFVSGKFSRTVKEDDSTKGKIVDTVDGMEIYRAGGPVTPPKTVFAPDPEYSDLARKYQVQGTSVLQLIVGTDGKPTHIEVKKPLGMELDEQGMAVMKNWRFTPGMKDGKPVAVRINVTFTFTLYPSGDR